MSVHMEDVLEPKKLAHQVTTALLVLIRSALQANLQKLLFAAHLSTTFVMASGKTSGATKEHIDSFYFSVLE